MIKLNKTRTERCQLRKDLKFTGRQISSKLVISKNKDSNGKNVTFIFVRRNSNYFFVPIADIYLDVNNRELIMPKGHPVIVAQGLYRDIIPSKKYKDCYVLAPDSDFQPIFKEVENSVGKKVWFMVYDEIVLHLCSWEVEYGDFDECVEKYLSIHQINYEEKIEEMERRERERELSREAEEMTDELFEEAGYDFMD